MKKSIFARFARAFFIFWRFEDVLVLSTTWNDLFCSCVDDVSRWSQMFHFVFLCPKRWFQFNSRIVRTHFSSIMTLNNCEIIAETRSYIFRWRSRFRRRRRVCLSSLILDRIAPRKKNWFQVFFFQIMRAKSNAAYFICKIESYKSQVNKCCIFPVTVQPNCWSTICVCSTLLLLHLMIMWGFSFQPLSWVIQTKLMPSLLEESLSCSEMHTQSFRWRLSFPSGLPENQLFYNTS